MIVPASSLPVIPPESPMAQMARHIGDLFGYLTGGNVAHTSGLFVERKLMQITIACREEEIEEKYARGKSQDPILVEKREKVILRLMRQKWSNTEVLDHFAVRLRTVEKVRKVWKEEEAQKTSCGVVAPARR